MTDLSFQTISPARGPLSRRVRLSRRATRRASQPADPSRLVHIEAIEAGLRSVLMPSTEQMAQLPPPVPTPPPLPGALREPPRVRGPVSLKPGTATNTPTHDMLAHDKPAAAPTSEASAKNTLPPGGLPETPWVRATRRRQITSVLHVIGAWALTLAVGGFIVGAVAILLLSKDVSFDGTQQRFIPAPAGTGAVASAPRPVDRVQWLANGNVFAAAEEAPAPPSRSENPQGR